MQPIKLSGAEKKIKNHSYILATGAQGPNFRRFYDKVKDSGWEVGEIKTGHLAMLEDPEGVAKMLLEERSRGARDGEFRSGARRLGWQRRL